jgi:hypothetical protein
MLGIDEGHLAQEDGSLPTTLAAGSAPGESGVSVPVHRCTAEAGRKCRAVGPQVLAATA